MSTNVIKTDKMELSPLSQVKSLLANPVVRQKFEDILGSQSASFTSSIIQLMSSNTDLSKCDANSVIGCALMAASVKLPINQNLGFAYILPYNKKQENGQYKQVPQFQMGYKGYIQLALRSGQVKNLNVTEVYDGEFQNYDKIRGTFDLEGARKTETIIGYAGYIALINGFEKYDFWPIDKLDSHGKRFSKTYAKGFGLWKDDFASMAKKTVIKALITHYCPLSIDMQNATEFDQATKQSMDSEHEYTDAVEVKMFDSKEPIEITKPNNE